MPFPNEHTARIRNPEEFEKDSFRSKNIYKGIRIIIGKLNGEDTTTTQAYRFDKDIFNVREAKEWLKEHNIEYILFEPASNPNEKDLDTYPIFIFDKFDENLSRDIIGNLLFYENFLSEDAIYKNYEENDSFVPSKSKIKMWINSPGGYVSDLMGIIDVIDNIKSPVETYCLGTAASCAAVLLSNGTKGKRFIGKNSYVLLHQVTSCACGQIEDLNINIEHANNINEQIIKILAKNTKKTKTQIKNDLSRDLWLNAEQAIEYGIVDKILDDNSNEVKFMDKMQTKTMQIKQNNIIEKEIEKKHITTSLEIKSTKEDDNNFRFSAYASSFYTEDLDNEIIEKGAFNRTLKTYNLLDNTNERPILWNHQTLEPIGKAFLKEDEKGLFVEAILPKDDDFVRGRIIPQIKVGAIKNMSFGFQTKDFFYKNNIRHIIDVDLFEVSLVTIPSNVNSKILSYKAAVPFQDLPLADEDMEWEGDKAIKRVSNFTGSEEKPSKKYKNAFLWYDEKNEELFGSYKLPIADVVNGQLKAVPRAIFAAAAVMKGARGGIDMPEKDKEKVKANINKYYKKMDRESPLNEKEYIFNNITDISKFLKTKGFTNLEVEDVIINLKRIILKPRKEDLENINNPWKKDYEESRKEISLKIKKELKIIRSKLCLQK